MRTTIKLLMPILLLGILASCKKETVEQNAVSVNEAKASIPTFVFDWENDDYVPVPPGATPILVPWASGSNQLFPSEIAFDFNKSDGWNMVYNTFSPTQATSPSFFALYNKYRGLLRFYLYIQPGNIVPSSYFSDGLELSGSVKSTLLNFSNQMADVRNEPSSGPVIYGPPLDPVTSLTRIQNFQVQSTGGWYVCQYEIAYDIKIGSTTQQSLNFVWNASTVNLSSILLNGQTNGTLSGTVGTESKGGFNLGKLLGQVAQGAVYAVGLKSVQGLTINNAGIKTSIESGIKSGLSGAVKGMFNAIFGGTPSSPQLVNLTLKTKTQMEGAISSNSSIVSTTLAIPGSILDNNTTGYVPAYTKALGVVNMRRPPVIHYRVDSVKTVQPVSMYTDKYTHTFNHNRSNDVIAYNPSVTSDGTTIQVLKTDIVVPYKIVKGFQGVVGTTPQYTDMGAPTIKPVFDDPSTLPTYTGLEKIGNDDYVIGGRANGTTMFIVETTHQYKGNILHVDGVDWKNGGIRYTFLVTPANGSAPITIVKTFKADFQPI